MISFSAPRSRALVVLAVGLVLSVLAGYGQHRVNRSEAQAQFEVESARAVASVVDRLHRYEFGLRSVRGAMLAGGLDTIDREHFLDYSRSREYAVEFPGARGFGFIRRVPKAEEAGFVKRERETGAPDFAIRQLSPHDGERYVIQYIEPLSNNRQALGLDVASERKRREAALRSLRSGEATISGPITLVQATGQPLQSFLMLLPVYRPHLPLDTEADRELAGVGWSYAPLVMAEVLQGLGLSDGSVTFELTDLGDDPSTAFYQSAGAAAPASDAFRRTITFDMQGRPWSASLQPTPTFFELLHQTRPSRVVAALAGLSLLLSFVAYLVGAGQNRKGQMHLVQAHRAAIVEASRDAIIVESLDGRVLDWNRGAELMFGYRASEARGQLLGSLLLPLDRLDEEQAILTGAKAGQLTKPFETTRLRSDGQVLQVSIAVSALMDAKGECVGVSKVIRDISVAHQARQALAGLNAQLESQVESRTQALNATLHDFRNILDALPSMIGYWDVGLVCRVVNKAYAQFIEKEPVDMVGKAMQDLLPESILAVTRPHVAAVLEGHPQTFEGVLPAVNGNGPRKFLAYYLPDVVDGEVKGFYVLVHDLTELNESREQLKQAHRLLEKRERFLQNITDHLPVCIAYTNQRGEFEFANATFCRQLQRSREDILGRTHAELLDAKGLSAADVLPFAEVLSRGKALRIEHDETRDSAVISMDTHLVPDVAPDGAVQGVYMVSTDITERRQAERELRETMTLLNSVLAAASQVSIVAVKPDGLVSVFNKGAETLLGYRKEEVVGKMSSLAFHDEEEMRHRAGELSGQLGRKVRSGEVLIDPAELGRSREWTYVRKDGGRVPVSLGITAMHDAQNELVGYLGIAYDVSQQKAYERSLRDAVHKARRANQAKTQFLANMSHEIRTPMNAVIGLSYLLERTELNGEQGQLLSKIKVASKSLLSLINDVLDLSKIEASELTIERAPFSFTNLLRDIAELVSLPAEAKGVDFQLQGLAQMPEVLMGDATRLHQVLVNLLTNAVKFTDEGGQVRLSLSRAGGTANHPRLRFVVSDSGIGMSESQMGRLFTPFVQADASTTRRFGGTGLGLSIVKQLVQLMGGAVGVTSEPGQGSEFWVELDFEVAGKGALAAATAGEAAAQGARLQGIRVLVADDSEINLEVARQVLALEGAEVCLALNGQEAIDLLLAAPEEFDVVLLDLQMPVLDGFDTSRRIRSGLGLHALPIIALSASTLSSEMALAKHAGMNDFITKPFDVAQLVSRILHWVHHGDQAQSAPVAQSASGEADAWPEVDGLDTAAAQSRLGGDRTLFLSMLKRLFTEYAQLDGCLTTVDPDALAALSALLHKLKGSAGTLGAHGVERAAGLAERACRTQQVNHLEPLLDEVVEELHHLRQAVAPILLASEPTDLALAPSDGAPLDPGELDALISALQCNDLEAIERLNRMAPALRVRLGDSGFTQLREQVDNLDFVLAARSLQDLREGASLVPG